MAKQRRAKAPAPAGDAGGSDLTPVVSIFLTVQAVADAIRSVHKAFPDLHQQVTEMDVSVYNAGDNTSNFGANGGTVPPSIIAQQGWLYYNYFKAFRSLRGILDGVTFWGMADDNTWLSGFPISRLNEPLPFNEQLQAKPAYWGIINQPRELPRLWSELPYHREDWTEECPRVDHYCEQSRGGVTAYAVQIPIFGSRIQQLRDNNGPRQEGAQPCSSRWSLHPQPSHP